MKKPIYHRHGKQYRKLERHEIIKAGALHSVCYGELMPIINDETIGQTPAEFSNEREFFNPIDVE